ncbi:serine/threonine kinase with two-component sensor domain [Planoprotostelium fungivorum]|uniref:Serine/threonine kinase with two-component sensor domain n=1 Tax=Planoprotostelium fungivorum TaxID=1890364 RepID=A0A2P6N613_9EUKA|nr:serine/threonine kinase with two-component sensor domain [Planoprotostelium fungivorum]
MARIKLLDVFCCGGSSLAILLALALSIVIPYRQYTGKGQAFLALDSDGITYSAGNQTDIIVTTEKKCIVWNYVPDMSSYEAMSLLLWPAVPDNSSILQEVSSQGLERTLRTFDDSKWIFNCGGSLTMCLTRIIDPTAPPSTVIPDGVFKARFIVQENAANSTCTSSVFRTRATRLGWIIWGSFGLAITILVITFSVCVNNRKVKNRLRLNDDEAHWVDDITSFAFESMDDLSCCKALQLYVLNSATVTGDASYSIEMEVFYQISPSRLDRVGKLCIGSADEIMDIIYRGPHSVVYRVREDGSPTCIVKTAVANPSVTMDKYQIEKRYMDQLCPITDYVLRCTELRRESSQLIVEDFSGMSLFDFRQNRGQFSIEEFFKTSIKMCEGLDAIHQAGVVHRNICSQHILLDDASCTIKFIDFSLATNSKVTHSTSLPFESQFHHNYISPEQTTRIDKRVDYRSDYYSLGVVMFEMLTGRLPFDDSTDPAKIIYNHIAKEPPNPSDLCEDIPLTLSSIILKLLSKDAQDRYQSMFGLIYDLQQCSAPTNETIQLGSRDIPSTIQIAFKMYGREDQLRNLVEIYDDVSKGKRLATLVSVSGQSGIGKTMLIENLRKHVENSGGKFVVGKVDQLRKNTPYASVILALQQFVRGLLTEGEERLRRIKSDILSAMHHRGQAMIDLIPQLGLVLGEQPMLPEVGPLENQARFRSVFIDFLGAIATEEDPLTIFLDDLQWADHATMSLIEHLINQMKVHHLCVVIAYRDVEVDDDHPLKNTLDRIDRSMMHEIKLTPITQGEIEGMIADTFFVPRDQAVSLGDIVWMKTQGNPLLVNVFLENLVAEKHITWQSSRGRWIWDTVSIIKANIAGDTIHLMTSRISRHDEIFKKILSIAACAGNGCKLKYLRGVVEISMNEILEVLRMAVVDNLISLSSDFAESDVQIGEISINFSHDKVQQAAYEMISHEQRPLIHLHIAHSLLSEARMTSSDEYVFQSIPHFSMARWVIQDEREKMELARICLKSAQSARKAAAYGSGRDIAELGIAMVGETGWEEEHGTTLALYLISVEFTYMTGDYDRAETMYPGILEKWDISNVRLTSFDRCKTNTELSSVYFVQAMHYEYQQQYAKSVDTYRLLLKAHDIHLPPLNTPDNEIEKLSIQIFEKCREIVGSDPSMIYNLPITVDRGHLDCMKTLALIWPAAKISGSPSFLALCCTIGLYEAVRHGNNEWTPLIYVQWSPSGVLFFKDLAWVYQIAEVGYNLAEGKENEGMHQRLLFVYGWALHQYKSLREAKRMSEKSVKRAEEVADNNTIFYSGNHVVAYSWHAGFPLTTCLQELDKFVQHMKSVNNLFIMALFMSLHLPVLVVTEKSEDFEREEEKWREQWASHPLISAGYTAGSVQRFFWRKCSTDTPEVFQLVRRWLDIRFVFVGCGTSVPKMTGMSYVTLSRLTWGRTVLRNFMEKFPKELENYAKFCEGNHQYKIYLLRAEECRSKGLTSEGTTWLQKAADSAKSFQFIQWQAYSYERLADFMIASGLQICAKGPVLEAHALYKQWGASLKCNQLRRNHSHSFQSELRSLPPNSDSSSSDGTLARVTQYVDLDMSTGQLIQIMMEEAMQSAGARRGLFLLIEPSKDGNVHHMERHVIANGEVDRLEVNVEGRPLDASMCPISLINLVSRTLSPIIISNASSDPQVSNDIFVKNNKISSLLCVPILSQRGVRGIILFYNDLMAEAFNEKRLKVVTAIGVQMIVHIDSSRLNRMLKKETDHLKATKVSMEDFIDALCHEVRNPLNGIFGSQELLRDMVEKQRLSLLSGRPDVTDISKNFHEQLELISSISISAEHLKDLLDTVLNVSSIQKNPDRKAYVIRFNPKMIVHNVGLMFKAKLKGLELYLNETCSEEREVMGDPRSLSQILINLVGNAVKFTRVGGITIGYDIEEAHEGHVTIRYHVKDTGIGMDPGEISKIFRPFTQANEEVQDMYGGNGLGLTLAKKILEEMNGQILIESEKERGTTCYVVIRYPLATKFKRNLDERKDTETRPAKRQVTEKKSKKILVVDDNIINQKILKKILEGQGWDVDVADNGSVAVSMFLKSREEGNKYDVITMDIEMPVMDGIQSTQRIRKIEQDLNTTRPIIIIGVSANTRDVHEKKAIGCGMDSYLHKPFHRETIIATISNLLSTTED